MNKTSIRLSDGRELIYFGGRPQQAASYPDLRELPGVEVLSEQRYDQLRGEWVVIASQRQNRTFRPAQAQCPLDPSSEGNRTEIPAPDYDVVVFENRFSSLGAQPADPAHPADDGLMLTRPAAGRCEVICFSPDHGASFADLAPAHAQIVLAAWTDRSTELARLPGVEQVYCFENRGAEIGATLSHPHGQIFAYPYDTPRTERMLAACAGYRQRTGGNLFDDLLAAEEGDGTRIVAAGQHWTAFVPHAAHWPYEVHLYPRRRVPDLAALTDAARTEFASLYLDILARFDRLFDTPAPYISAWHQAPVRRGRDEFALHLELFSIRRAPGKLKYLAGSESGMDAFLNDVSPEAAALRLRELA